MLNGLCAVNKLKDVDKAFFIICAVIIVLIVAVYFLIPVFNKKFYQEQRENLHKREAAFKSNLQGVHSAKTEEGDGLQETPGEEKATEGTDAEKSEVPKDE